MHQHACRLQHDGRFCVEMKDDGLSLASVWPQSGPQLECGACTNCSNQDVTCAACFFCRYIAAAIISSPILLAAAAGQAKSLKEAEQE